MRVAVVVTDLDNTLNDWVEQWYRSFRAMLDELVRVSGIPEATLIAEIKAVHEKHGTAEYRFLIEELPSLRKLHPNDKLETIFKSAIEAYRSAPQNT